MSADPNVLTLSPARATQVTDHVRWATELEVFCRDILGFHDLIAPHAELCRFLQTDRTPTKLILMPRYSFKSSIATIGYSLWRLVRDDSLRILIYSHSNAKAEGFLTEIKNHVLGLKTGSRFRQVYGPWESDPKQGLWNQAAIIVSARKNAQAEPSIDTAGIETGKVGAHYDLIVFDDIVAKENVTTKDQMDKVLDVYRASRSLLKPGGDVILLGTRWHFGDLYGRLLAERDQGATLAVCRRQAQEEDRYPFAAIGLTPGFLKDQRSIQGTYVHSCLYQNAPVDDATAPFKASDFAFYDPTLRASRGFQAGLFITCCVDPAISLAQDADQTAITVVGTDDQWNLYLLDLVLGRLLPDDQLEAIMSLHARWRFQVLGIETTAFQRMLARDLHRRVWEQRRRQGDFAMFQIDELKGFSQRSKKQRIMGLQPYHEAGRIKFPGTRLELLEGDWKTLAHQLLEFPHNAYDDVVDSLASHVHINRIGQAPIAHEAIPYGSPAWAERQQFEEDITVMEQRPRWLRQPVDALVFS